LKAPKLYTVKEVSEILKIHKNQVYEKINNGDIVPNRLGTGLAPPIRITHDNLMKFINGSKRG
jgi:excisionase family DNA binding protein